MAGVESFPRYPHAAWHQQNAATSLHFSNKLPIARMCYRSDGRLYAVLLLRANEVELARAQPAYKETAMTCGSGGKLMNGATAAKHTEQPLLGEAALQDALAQIRTAPSASGATHANGNAAPGQTELAPKTVSQVLGEITWLMTQSPRHKAIALGDLEWLVMPAILLRQFRLFYKGEQPVGVALWALADDLVAKRIDTGDRRLTAVEWKSGTNMRIAELVAPFGGEAEMLEQVEQLSGSKG
jgi:cytolysin-activating lysine-acyltransferase